MMILLTGASKGIGLSLAQEFASHGHDLILVARNEEQLKEVSLNLSNQYKVKVDYQVCDLSKAGSALTLYNSLKNQGVHINCLVNNAGIGFMGSYAEMDAAKLQDLMHINMISLSELTRLYLKDFLAQNDGYILQLASTAAFLPGPFMAAYYASKAYVSSLSHAIAYELKGTKVSLSILCPGPTRTNFQHAANMEHSKIDYLGMMTPEQVAKIAYKGMLKKKLYIIPGIMNKITVFLISISPKAVATAVVAFLHGKVEA